jgi:hypothetical protein
MDLTTFANGSIWLLVKAAFLLGILIYIVFAVIVVRQVKIMMEALDVGFEKVIRLLAYLHLLGSIASFLLALIIL